MSLIGTSTADGAFGISIRPFVEASNSRTNLCEDKWRRSVDLDALAIESWKSERSSPNRVKIGAAMTFDLFELLPRAASAQ